jgi:hypothetical protein
MLATRGLSIIEVPSREEALKWAAKIAVACRCAQEVREIMPDPGAKPSPVPSADARDMLAS